MRTLVRTGKVLSPFDPTTYGFTARDEETRESVFVHVTSWLSRYPGLLPAAGEAIDLVYANDPPAFLLARPRACASTSP